MRARDVGAAIALVEGAVAQRMLVGVDGVEPGRTNVFGDSVAHERGHDVPALLARCLQAAGDGERVAVVARATDLASARAELARIAARRLGVVVHCIVEPGHRGDPPSLSGLTPALSLGDLPWGMLVAAGVAEAADLALVARRAAEDSGCPFFVLHQHGHAHPLESASAPARDLSESVLGGNRMAPPPTGGDDRTIAERVPFALGSALRDLEALVGRRQDVLRRAPSAETSLALVGLGPLGDSLLAEADRLRAGGHDVGALRLIAWRPFPGPRLVKALARAHAVSVLEEVDHPLGGGGPLAVELKAAFADAITWAPGYPGIGRVPRIVSAVVGPHRTMAASDVDALVDNLVADERGTRSLLLGRRDTTPPP
jgi:pyruvate-ferredoxin/flavodoxin oxidoreductase